MKITEIHNNLFKVNNEFSLGHCVSHDCNISKSWGAGIAVQFRNRYPGIKEYCAEMIKKYNLPCPTVIPYYVPSEDRYIFNLITKTRYFKKPSYSSIGYCIKYMAIYCEKFDIHKLALPLIGCGLDKLQWNKVRELIELHFKKLDTEILICHK